MSIDPKTIRKVGDGKRTSGHQTRTMADGRTADVWKTDDLTEADIHRLAQTAKPSQIKKLMNNDEIILPRMRGVKPRTGTHNPLYMAELKARIASLFADNLYQREIAEVIREEYGLENYTGEAVSYHINNMLEHWRVLATKSIDEKQALVLARIAQIEELATNAYFRSMEGKTTVVIEKQIERAQSKKNLDALRDAVKAEVSKAEEEGREINLSDSSIIEGILVTTAEKIKEYERNETNDAGDPRFLQIMLDCQDKRCKIWGLYLKDADELNKGQEYAKLTDQERAQKIRALLDRSVSRQAERAKLLAEGAPLGGPTDDDSGKIEADRGGVGLAGSNLTEDFFNQG